MGDLLFNHFHPRVDRAAGASIQNWMKIFEKGAKDKPADTIFIARHAETRLPPTGGPAGGPALQKQVAAATANAPEPTVADVTFEKTWSQKAGEETITAAFNGPGHTGADGFLHFEKAHVVHMGDLLFNHFHPRVDRAAGASIQNWMKILEKVAKDMPADTIFIAGHAKTGLPPTVDRQAVLAFRDYFDAVLTLTRKAVAAGQTKDALVATSSLPGFDDYQAAGAALSLAGVLGVAYDELTAK